MVSGKLNAAARPRTCSRVEKSAEPLFERLDPPRRAAVVMAILALVLVGLAAGGLRDDRRPLGPAAGAARTWPHGPHVDTSRTNGSATPCGRSCRRARRRNDHRQAQERRNRGGSLSRKRTRHDMAELRFPKRLRLLKPGEFERVMAARSSATDGLVRMYGAANDFGHPRLGLTVSRKRGRRDDAQRWKRALREAFRLAQHELPPATSSASRSATRRPTSSGSSNRCAKLAHRIDAASFAARSDP